MSRSASTGGRVAVSLRSLDAKSGGKETEFGKLAPLTRSSLRSEYPLPPSGGRGRGEAPRGGGRPAPLKNTPPPRPGRAHTAPPRGGGGGGARGGGGGGPASFPLQQARARRHRPLGEER